MHSTDGDPFGSPGPSIWSLIKEHVTVSEQQKIRMALGQSLIDMYKELHSEAEMWHTMWQERQKCENHSSKTGIPLSHQRSSPLADPPVVKDLVRAEVRMLLQTLREWATTEGRNVEDFVCRYQPETVNYALGRPDGCHSNSTWPADSGSRSSSRCTVQSSAADEIETMRDKLNIVNIDQVADCLKAILIEECEALKEQIKQLQVKFRHKSEGQRESKRSEPTLAELKDLREVLQMDLEVYQRSVAPSAVTPLPAKDMKNRLRLPSGQMASDKSLIALSATSVLRPHPPPALYHSQPRPPAGPLVSKTPRSIRPMSALSRPHCQNRSTIATVRETETTTHNRTRSVNPNSQFTTSLPRSGMEDMINYDSSSSSEHDTADLCCTTRSQNPSFQIKTERNSPTHKAHLSSSCSFHNRSRECDLSPQMERKCSLAWRSRNINTVPSPVSARSPLCDGSSYECNNSSSTNCYLSTKGEAKTQNGYRNRGVSSVSQTAQVHNDKQKRTPELVYSSISEETLVVSEVERTSTKTGNQGRTSGINKNKISNLRRNVRQQSVKELSSHHPENSGRQKQDTASEQKNEQFFTVSKRVPGGNANQQTDVQQSQTDTEFLNRFVQPCPPARVST